MRGLRKKTGQRRSYLGTLDDKRVFRLGKNVSETDGKTVGLLGVVGIKYDPAMKRKRDE